MRLVDEDVIDTELVEDEAVILLVASEQILEAFLPRRFLFLDGLNEVAIGAPVGGVLAQQFVVFSDLLAQEFLLVLERHADPLEAAVRDDDAVPLVACDLGGEELPALA